MDELVRCCCVVMTDVIGIVKSTDDVRTINSKQGKELKKRDITLVDESQVQIRLTLWANDVSPTCLPSVSVCSREARSG